MACRRRGKPTVVLAAWDDAYFTSCFTGPEAARQARPGRPGLRDGSEQDPQTTGAD